MLETNQEITIVDKKLASRMSRFWAAFIDALIALGSSLAILYATDFGEKIMSSEIVLPMEAFLLMLYGWGVFLLCHGYLLYKNGQTFGKWVFDISIVKLDNSKIEFAPVLLKRYLPISLVTYLPVIGSFLPVLDALFIFRKDRRCIHDFIAGTKVVQLEKTVEPSEQKAEIEC
ncbi:RDD family protein [Vibrio parahaemolyticus]|uniref:RDD family protein n=4 Tax=Vibrio TaxID=662 RepID=UPI00111CB4B0|nr:RDD family protein [Vibrio parahaemolyticus]TNZ87271.1 RDD family protein [Vibrio parahaemolyticus]